MKEARFTEEELVKLLKPFHLRDVEVVSKFLAGQMNHLNIEIQIRNMVMNALQAQLKEMKEIQKLSEGTANLKCQSVIETSETLIYSLNKIIEASQIDFDHCRSFDRTCNIAIDEFKEANSVELLQTLDDKFWEKWDKIYKRFENENQKYLKEYFKEIGVNVNPSSDKPE